MLRSLPLSAVVLLAALASPVGAQDAPPLDWDPAKTVVFGVGVITFKDEGVATWPQEGRRDVELMALFRERGAKEVVHLTDREATKQRLERDFAVFLDRSQPGQTLVFYYTGHGFKDGAEVGVAPWDVGGTLDTTWRVSAVVEAIATKFKGDRVLLVADCCHSGALAEAAAKKDDGGRLAWAALTSSQKPARSTGNWTFTESLLAGLRGDPRVDVDANGIVALGELFTFAADEMAFGEEQVTDGYTRGSRFGASARLARAAGARAPRIGEHLEVEAEDSWWKARVLEVKGDRVKVRYYGWAESFDEWVGPDRVRTPRFTTRAVGSKVEIEWKGEWFPGRVLEARSGMHKVHYDGYDETWDEWVPAKRLREPGAKDEPRRGGGGRRQGAGGRR